MSDNNEFEFDFREDKKGDILTLKYNKDYTIKKTTQGVLSYYSYRLNKNIDGKTKNRLLRHIKDGLVDRNIYQNFINKAVLGLFNNPNISVNDVDLILIPESSSDLNLDIANQIKAKLPNAFFVKDTIVKNIPNNIQIDYDFLKKHNYKEDTIKAIEKMLENAKESGVFSINKIKPMFRKSFYNFLTIDITNRELFNKIVNGKILIVDDIITTGNTFREIEKLINSFAPKEVILYTLIA